MNAKNEINEILQTLKELDHFNFEEAQRKGCSRKTVDSFNKYAASGHLPSLYRQFLRTFGGYLPGNYLGSYYFHCHYLDEIQQEARQAASHHENFPADAFFFATFDYVDYFYFRTHEKNNNPPVYMCSEKRPPLLMYRSFWHFLLAEMGDVRGVEGEMF